MILISYQFENSINVLTFYVFQSWGIPSHVRVLQQSSWLFTYQNVLFFGKPIFKSFLMAVKPALMMKVCLVWVNVSNGLDMSFCFIYLVIYLNISLVRILCLPVTSNVNSIVVRRSPWKPKYCCSTDGMSVEFQLVLEQDHEIPKVSSVWQWLSVIFLL